MYWWVEFNDHKRSGTICAHNETEAKALGMQYGDVASVSMLPYPASPCLHKIDCPPFCYSPNSCKGRSSCPKEFACSE